ncbi:MAG: DUF3137 domain-containing protein [Alphaproteobacteria bacterium]|nr:MAG: DUF3137 domain-containing protein [Alphaproteobacteria bacterium]
MAQEKDIPAAGEDIAPALEKLDAFRREKYASYQKHKKTAALLALVLVPAALLIDANMLPDTDFPIAAICSLLLLTVWAIAPRLTYAAAYKKHALPALAALLGDFTYQEDGKIPAEDMRPSKILPHYDRITSEDYFKGRYKNTDVCFAEIKLEEEQRTMKYERGKYVEKKEFVAVFQGIAVLVTMPENKFFGHTIAVRNRGSIAEYLHEKATGLKRADLVSPAFEKDYDVYTSDQVEARYLIDPLMIERIQALKGFYDTEGISLAYYDNRFLALIPSEKNLFEPPKIDIRTLHPEILLALKQEIENVLHIVDQLRLYDPRKHRD